MKLSMHRESITEVQVRKPGTSKEGSIEGTRWWSFGNHTTNWLDQSTRITEYQGLVSMIVGIRQHDLFAGHPLVIDDDWRFEIDGCLQRVFRNNRDDQLYDVVVLLNVEAMEILKRECAHIGTKDQMWINDGEGYMLVVERLQPFERQ